MVNKVLAAFMVTDGLFVAMGAIMLGFSVIVQQTCFDTPGDGNEAARDLLYQKFPFTGEATLGRKVKECLLTGYLLASRHRQRSLRLRHLPGHDPRHGDE